MFYFIPNQTFIKSVRILVRELMSAKSTINTSMNFREWGLLLALSILWGCSFFFNGVAVRELPTFTIVVGRVALASLTLLLVMSVAGQQMPRNRRVWFAFGGMGFLNNVVPFCLIVRGAGTGCIWSCLNSQCDHTSVYRSRCSFYDLR